MAQGSLSASSRSGAISPEERWTSRNRRPFSVDRHRVETHRRAAAPARPYGDPHGVGKALSHAKLELAVGRHFGCWDLGGAWPGRIGRAVGDNADPAWDGGTGARRATQPYA